MVAGVLGVLVVGGVLMLRKAGDEDEEDYDEDGYSCQDCDSQLRYIAQYDAWYCDECGDYQ
jgi:hypothetical protein